jgi:hypothetical protein
MSELDLTAIAGSSIATPGAGVGACYYDSTGKVIAVKDDTGFVRSFGRNNFSVAAQAPAAATRTYLTGSALAMPTTKGQIGSMFRWRWNMTKTAAGVAASTIDVCVGVNGTTADTARLSFTKPAGTAVIDEAWCEIMATLRGPLSAAGILAGQFMLKHNLAATGHAVIPIVTQNVISAGFDVTTAGLIVGVCLTSGAADAITIQLMQAEAINL